MLLKLLLSAIAALVLLWVPTITVRAANVTMTASDIFTGNESSLDTSLANGNHWNNGVVPNASNDYSTGNFVLRTPATSNSLTFTGNSLTINNSNDFQIGGLWYKGADNSGVITVDNLILNGGIITHQQGNTDYFNLAGSLYIAADSQIFPRQGTINVHSTITGSATLTIPGSNNSGNVLRLLAPDNTFTGNIVNSGRLELVDDNLMRFVIGAPGVNNSISGNGPLTALNGDIAFDLGSAGTTLGNSWSIVTAESATYGSSFNIVGFTQVNNVWRKGIYQFSENTGILSVAPAAGDVNGDGSVDQVDYATILAHFRITVSSRAEGDLNGDSFVDLSDFAEWRLAREQFVLSFNAQVPEPSSICLCFLTGSFALCQRRREWRESTDC